MDRDAMSRVKDRFHAEGAKRNSGSVGQAREIPGALTRRAMENSIYRFKFFLKSDNLLQVELA